MGKRGISESWSYKVSLWKAERGGEGRHDWWCDHVDAGEIVKNYMLDMEADE